MQVSENGLSFHTTYSSSYSETTFKSSNYDTISPGLFEPELASPKLPSNEGGTPDVIPPFERKDKKRNLVLCFDGTGDQFDSDNSNIVQLFSMLKKDNCDEQMCYYQSGIGTYTSPQVATPLMAKVSKTLDEMFAWNLGAHVMDGYEFLMQNYKAGDKICIFGFSRGAYTARALAAMIYRVGIIPACNHQQVPFAYKIFTRIDELGWKQSIAFKKAFSVDADIESLGVWDTVDSVGLIPRGLPLTEFNPLVRTFRHAIALDERRVKFSVNHWIKTNIKIDEGGHPLHFLRDLNLAKSGNAEDVNMEQLPTDVEEVWFAGCHCDVGGGSVENETPHSLARIPLRWMIRECFKANTGIMFHSERLQRVGLDPARLYPVVKSREPPLPVAPGVHIEDIPAASEKRIPINTNSRSEPHLSEEDHELLDALSPVYDQLSLAPGWWILELLPMHQIYDNGYSFNSTRMMLTWHMGRGRIIPRQKKGTVKVHRSVKQRMEAEYEDGRKYVPNASFEKAIKHGNLVWVD